MKSLCDRVEAALRGVLCVLLVAMTITVIWQVLSRFLAQISVALNIPLLFEPSRWTEELAGFQLGWVALLGAVYALRKHEHLGFDYLYLKMGPRTQRRIDLTVYSLITIFSMVVLVYGGLRLVFMTFQLRQTTPALQWPMGIIYGVIPLSGLLMSLFAIESMFRERPHTAEEHDGAVL